MFAVRVCLPPVCIYSRLRSNVMAGRKLGVCFKIQCPRESLGQGLNDPKAQIITSIPTILKVGQKYISIFKVKAKSQNSI